MADILGQMFMNATVGTRQYGWSENHYVLGVSDLPTALNRMSSLAAQRVRLLGAGVSLPYIRVSDRLVFRDSQVAQIAPPPFMLNPAAVSIATTIIAATQPPTGWPANNGIYNNQMSGELQSVKELTELRCDFPYSGLLIRLEGGSTFTARRSLILRGNPDVSQHTDIDRPNSGPFNTALNAYLAYLTSTAGGASFGFRVLNAGTPTTTYVATAVTWTQQMALNGLWQPAITFTSVQQPPAPTNWPVGTRVRIRNLKLSDPAGNKLNLKGVWTVASNTAGAVTFLQMYSLVPFPLIVNGGQSVAQAYTVIPYNKTLSRRWAMRKTGGPFDRPRGKLLRRVQSVSIRVDP